MSTKKDKKNKPKNASKNKFKAALAKQNMKNNGRDLLSQKQMSTRTASLDDAKECELEYLAAKLDPFGAKTNPCSLGYKNIPSIVCKKEARIIVNAGPGGLAFLALNPYLAASEDTNAIAYSQAAYPDVNAWNFGTYGPPNVTAIPLTGGVFTESDLNLAEDQPGYVASRVVSAEIRMKPMGAAVKTQGICIGRQITVGGEQISSSTTYPTSVQVSDALQDITKPIFNVTNDGEWTSISWVPLTVPEGDLVSHTVFQSNLGHLGASLWLGVSGAENAYPFLFEVVVISEYVSLKKALGFSKPSHQNQSVAAMIDTVINANASHHGPAVQSLYEGAKRMAAYLAMPVNSVVEKVLDKIADDGSWGAALGAAVGSGAAAFLSGSKRY